MKLLAIAAILTAFFTAACQSSPPLVSKVIPPVHDPKNAADAEQMCHRATTNATWKWGYTGEQFGWNTNGDLHSFLRRYEATGNTAYLDAGVKYYDAILAKMATGPDGYKGYIGPFIYNNKVWCDVHVGDALIFEGVLEFGVLVMRDPPSRPNTAKRPWNTPKRREELLRQMGLPRHVA